MSMFTLAISCWLLQFTLIHGPNIPSSYAILFYTALDFTSITCHNHNWALFSFWLSLFILSEAIFPLFSSRSSQNFFSIIVWGIDLDYHDTELFALEMNRDHSVVFEIASKYFILDSFVDYDGYSTSSKGFLPMVVDLMIIWVHFTHSCPF